ncbi:MAG: hypothetical protein ACR2QX_02885 [Woeseiaceae bacterium]
MRADTRKLFGAGFMLATLLAAFAAFSQEVGDGLEPAVDTSAMLDETVAPEPAVDTSTDEREEIEPAVSSATLAQDVTRNESSQGVMDEITLGRTEITGNQELPKVLYIVPWQKADPGDLTGRPVNTLLDEVLAPLDREEFTRQVDYYGDLYGDE